MKYYFNGALVDDLEPSCRNTSMKTLAYNAGIICDKCGDDIVLYNIGWQRDVNNGRLHKVSSMAVKFPGIEGIVSFIYEHFGVRI